jgi:hypothetical protein
MKMLLLGQQNPVSIRHSFYHTFWVSLFPSQYFFLKRFCSVPLIHFILVDGINFPQLTSAIGNSGPMLSIETIEKMMEDPAMQKMVYP